MALAVLAQRGYELRNALFSECLPEERGASSEVRERFEEVCRPPRPSYGCTLGQVTFLYSGTRFGGKSGSSRWFEALVKGATRDVCEPEDDLESA